MRTQENRPEAPGRRPEERGAVRPEASGPRPEVKSHEDLVVWQKAVDLVARVYQLIRKFPATEAYGLTAQITRSATSIPANIAEGRGRFTRKEYANFVSIARGSLMETRNYLTIAVRVGYLSEADSAPALSLVTEIGKMLTALRNRLQAYRPVDKA